AGNTALGFLAGLNVHTASSVICIGAKMGGADVSGTTWIDGIYGVTTQSGTAAPVIVSDTGQLGTVASSERFKKDIASMEKASEAILALRPVPSIIRVTPKKHRNLGWLPKKSQRLILRWCCPTKKVNRTRSATTQ